MKTSMHSQIKERKQQTIRLIVSTIVTIFIHVLLFVLFVFVLPENIFEPPEEFIGPIYIELENLPEFVPDMKDSAQPSLTNDKEPVESVIEHTDLPETTNTELPGRDNAEIISPVENPEQTIPGQNPEVEPEEDTEEEFIDKTADETAEEPEQSALDITNLSELDKILENRPDNTSIQPENEPGNSDITLTWEDAQSREAVYLTNPVLPEWISTQGLSLRVVVSFILVPQGFLINITLKESCGYTEVDTAVINAIRNWRFRAVNSTVNVRGSVTYYIRTQ